MAKKDRQSIPYTMRPIYESVTGLTDDFCHKYLNDEYAELCRKMAATLCRKRPSPLSRGKIEIWSCAIAYAIGRINFLFDKSQTPHMRADELCEKFGVSQSTASAKANRILDSMKIMLMDPRWSLPSKLGENPMAWMIQVNGLIVDARYMPREIQEEAYRLGLIPYIP